MKNFAICLLHVLHVCMKFIYVSQKTSGLKNGRYNEEKQKKKEKCDASIRKSRNMYILQLYYRESLYIRVTSVFREFISYMAYGERMFFL